MKQSYVLQAFMDTPWAILPQKLAAIEEIVMRHVNGEKLSAEEIQARIQGANRPQDQRLQGVAVMPLFGTIIPRADVFSEISGATSAERFGNEFTQLIDDPQVSAIVLDVDSPGGQVNGVLELSDKIYNARGKKPIVAVVNHTMASAAYWIGTAADEIVISPSGELGSIGVFSVHRDYSSKLEKDGVRISLISKGKFKISGNPYEPLAEEARASIQESVDEIYNVFVDAVARNRGVEAAAVRNGFGEGGMVNARKAVALGMADRVGTLEETIDQLLNKSSLPATAQAHPFVNVPQVLLQRAENVEAEQMSEASEQADAKPDPRKVESLRNYLKVFANKKKRSTP